MTPEEALEIVRKMPQIITIARYATALEIVAAEHDRLINENNSLAARVRSLYDDVGYLENRVEYLEDELNGYTT